MAKKKKKRNVGLSNVDRESVEIKSEKQKSRRLTLGGRQRWFAVGIIVFLALGALGAGLKYLEEDAKRQMQNGRNLRVSKATDDESSILSRINPFVSNPPPSPTPQLSKEYIYAGGKLLAIEDVNANSAPPADLAIWRPSSGVWYVMGGIGSAQTIQGWGTTGDVPTQGDFDGDGKTDFCIFRPSSNQWWILRSSDGNYYSVTLGQSGDKPAQADYDGDGKTDVAIFRPSTGTWFILQSSNSQTIQQQFGLSTDTPAAADYDGDGRADIGVWRDGTAVFYSLNSSNSTLQTISYGQTGDVPVCGDYDGDGRADYALKRGNQWFIRQSANSQTQTITWEQANDQPVQNDYDGDGKLDVAVWRNSNGNWYIRKSGSNGALRQEAWGTSGDIPVPAYYRR